MLTSPLSWFASLSAENKMGFAQRVIEAFGTVDPGFADAQKVWRSGKTVRLEGIIDGRSMGFHLSIEGGDQRLLELAIKRIRRADLEWNPVRADLLHKTENAYAAKLGRGTLLVFENMGELIVMAKKMQVAPVPEGLAVGNPLPIGLPASEGFILMIFEGQPLIIGSFENLSAREIKEIKKGRVDIGLVPKSQHILFLGLKIDGFTDGWSDLPFALGLEKIEHHRLNAPDLDGRAGLILILAERPAATVRALRSMRLPVDFTTAFHQAIEDQQDALQSFSRADFTDALEQARRGWPHPNDMEREMTIRARVD